MPGPQPGLGSRPANPGPAPRPLGERFAKAGTEAAVADLWRTAVDRGETLRQADAVICPADCVGHPAYYQLKRHCKQAGKPCVMPRGSGLASFADGLNRLAQGRLDIGAAVIFPAPTYHKPS